MPVEGPAIRQGGGRAFRHLRRRPRAADHGLLRAGTNRSAGQAYRLCRRANDGRRRRTRLRHRRPAPRRPANDGHRRRERPDGSLPDRSRIEAAGRLVVELSDDRGPAGGAELPRRRPRRRHGVFERLAPGGRPEQFQCAAGGRVPRFGRGQPFDRPRRVLAQYRQQDRPGRLPGYDRERAEFRHLAGRPRRGHLRRQRGSYGHPLRRAGPHQPIRLLSGRVREDAADAAGPRVRRRHERHRGPKDRCGTGKVQCRLSVGLGPGRAMAAGDRPRRSAPGGRAGQRAGRRPAAPIAAGNGRYRRSSIAPRWPLGWSIS